MHCLKMLLKWKAQINILINWTSFLNYDWGIILVLYFALTDYDKLFAANIINY